VSIARRILLIALASVFVSCVARRTGEIIDFVEGTIPMEPSEVSARIRQGLLGEGSSTVPPSSFRAEYFP
jgi:hypothetical protein